MDGSMTAHEAELQERVFAFLTDPARQQRIQRIDTHAASVFLEGDRALKIKRAVRLPFLDYSTLAKRKAACDAEIRINRRFAPQIYHRVVAITQRIDGSLAIDGDGSPVEYAVEMARFDESQTLDHLAESGSPDPDLIDSLADTIAACHAVAPPAPVGPWINAIPGIIAGNTAAFRAAACFPADAIDDLDATSRAAFERCHGLLRMRGAQGHVRRCHGDMHLANIVLIEGKPVLFDAIEFDETIASVDVLYDLAFPIMDLIHHGRTAAANALLNRYLGLTAADHLGALGLLSLFLSMRAAIRAHVLLAQLDRGGGKADLSATARRYFEQACGAIHPPAPVLVAVGGLSGTGKSDLARALAPEIGPEPGAVVLRSDVLRKQHFGVAETERLPEAGYRPEITHEIYQKLLKRAAQILAQGHSVVVDAVFAEPAEREAVKAAARTLGCRFVGLFLRADLASRLGRVAHRQRDASDATPDIAGRQEHYDIGALDWNLIDASASPAQTLRQSLSVIGPGAARPARPSIQDRSS